LRPTDWVVSKERVVMSGLDCFLFVAHKSSDQKFVLASALPALVIKN